jgi:hypothetical protein
MTTSLNWRHIGRTPRWCPAVSVLCRRCGPRRWWSGRLRNTFLCTSLHNDVGHYAKMQGRQKAERPKPGLELD